MCHIGQTLTLIGAMQHGTCTVQPTQIAFSSAELKAMIRECGLNRLTQFATFLSMHLRNSRNDPELLALLKGLNEVLFAGLALPQTHFAHHEIARRDRLRAGEALGEVGCGSPRRVLLLLLSCVLSLSCTSRLSIPLYLLAWNIPPSPAYCLSPDEDS